MLYVVKHGNTTQKTQNHFDNYVLLCTRLNISNIGPKNVLKEK